MKFCSHCGAQIDDKAVICVKCGCSVAPESQQKPEVDPYDGPSVWGIIGSFLIPLLGLILFICWKNTSPIKAKSAGIAGIVGFVFGMILLLVL